MITYFEKHLRTADSIRCYFDTINVTQSNLSPSCSFKILASERRYKSPPPPPKKRFAILMKCLYNVVLQNTVILPRF